MFTVIIKNYDTGAEMIRLKVKKFDRPSDLIGPINKALETVDLFGMGLGVKVTDLGINAWTHTGNVCDSTNKRAFNGDRTIPATVKVICGEKIDTGVKVGFLVFPEGYILNTGKITESILGHRSSVYLDYISRSNVHSCGKSGCHVFPSLKSLSDYIHRHEAALRMLVSRHGYHFSVEYANDLYEREIEQLPEKKKVSLSERMAEIESFLEDINATAEEDDEDASLPEKTTHDDILDEADRRMNALNLWDRVILDYRGAGKVFQSEAGGIIYDLDDNAKTAVKETEDMGFLPYHVIVSHSTIIGTIYAVLYVSCDPEEWKCERPDKKGCMRAYVYNADHPELSELGDIYVESANGGIVRMY